MAVSLDEIDRLIEAGPKAEAAPDEIDRLIGTTHGTELEPLLLGLKRGLEDDRSEEAEYQTSDSPLRNRR